ncbi:hypothetical protein [Streptomyces griseoloalbus]|uniref:Cysteine dioxygenase n=1 Tax=Streptomyces griseoloalbus TaxID=67303 RepID=A0A7W8BJF8_9ACTN|nr:hypothetical protein [Streptomyces albaduncus]MBB5124569.1 hypothetical protein [Streptomyces albaduncus]GGW37911.1 hypothetical protein GCM10010340_14410 [Streptomyces albaduncus]
MGDRQVRAVRRLLARTLDGELPERDHVAAAGAVVTELGAPGRLLELVAELACGEGDPEGCARLSYRHVLGFDKLLLIDAGRRHMLRVHLWHEGAGGTGAEDIHNHRSALASHIVRGRLSMDLYEAHDDGVGVGGGIEAARYEESLADGSADWLLEPAGRARLRLTHTGRYAAGSTYALPARTLHRAWCDTDEPTVTLFLETGAERRRHTDVFTASGPHAGATAKQPLDVPGYLAALSGLAELLRGS